MFLRILQFASVRLAFEKFAVKTTIAVACLMMIRVFVCRDSMATGWLRLRIIPGEDQLWRPMFRSGRLKVDMTR